jgi:hypothetical protein
MAQNTTDNSLVSYNPFLGGTASGMQPNPYVPGTREYYDFQGEQINASRQMAGMPRAPEFLRSSAEGYRSFGPQMTPGTLQSGGMLATPEQVSLERMLPYASGATAGILGSRDTAGYDALRDRAIGSGPSPWLNLQLDRQKAEEAQKLDEANAATAGATAGAESAAAMRGGVSSGALERLRGGGLEAALKGQQGIRALGANERLGLQIADEDTRTKLLSQLPSESRAQTEQLLGGTKFLTGVGQAENLSAADIGLKNVANLSDTQKFNIGNTQDVSKFNVVNKQEAEKYNIGNYLNEMLQNRAQQNFQYAEQAKALGAVKTGEATANAGKK